MRSLAQLGLATVFTFSTLSFAQSTTPAPASTPADPQPPATSQNTPAPSQPAVTDDDTANKPPPPRTKDNAAKPKQSPTANTPAPATTPATTTSTTTSPTTTTPAADTKSAPAADSTDSKPATADATVSSGSTTDTKADPKSKSKAKAKDDTTTAKTDVLPSPGEALDPHIKPGSEDDVNAVGNRNIGGRGMGNWYSVDWEIRNGKSYSMEIEKSAHLVTDPVVVEYVNRVGQNIVKNSDCKVPFTIKVIDSDEINAMALPGGFFYVNSGLIMAADEEAELAGVMAHETAHVCAHHAAREMTRMNYIQIGEVPLIIMTQGTWTGYGIYEAMQLAIPITFLQFSRIFESEADWLGLQYMYKAGYDPQAFVQFFEKIDALEKHKPGTLAKVFADHPQTPDRIAHSEDEIATIMPAKPDYVVTTSEFDDVKARLARIENKRKINDPKGGNKPTLRRAGGTNNDPNNPNSGGNSSDGPPTLGRRN
jgi:beta-barrel assembly-enhancing protease